MRGEYKLPIRSATTNRELPPRARRIHRDFRAGDALRGTTSACAENTPKGRKCRLTNENYLRVRGEYHRHPQPPPTKTELPPRARRIHHTQLALVIRSGTTSACAENTWWGLSARMWWRNYLRVRGEYFFFRSLSSRFLELPPRARRILTPHNAILDIRGTTSACAENTLTLASIKVSARNYLRVRGEYPK